MIPCLDTVTKDSSRVRELRLLWSHIADELTQGPVQDIVLGGDALLEVFEAE